MTLYDIADLILGQGLDKLRKEKISTEYFAFLLFKVEEEIPRKEIKRIFEKHGARIRF